MQARENTKKVECLIEGGEILSQIHGIVSEAIEPGVTTQQLNEVAEKAIAKFGVASSFKGYQGFPGVLCTSVNE